jgi:WD40-like Beta Propeller Repeat
MFNCFFFVGSLTYISKMVFGKRRAYLLAAGFIMGSVSCSTQRPQSKEPAVVAKAVASAQSYEFENTKTIYLNYPTMAYYSVDQNHLLVTRCMAPNEFNWAQQKFCRPYRLYLDDDRWEPIRITGLKGTQTLESAVYSPDGKQIVGSVWDCFADYSCSPFSAQLALIDENGNLKILPSDRARYMPSFSNDGKKLLFYQMNNALFTRTRGALISVLNLHELNLETGEVKLLANATVTAPEAPARMLRDGVTVLTPSYEVRGQVTHKDVLYEFWQGDTTIHTLTLLYVDLVKGSAVSLDPPGENGGNLFDQVAHLNCFVMTDRVRRTWSCKRRNGVDILAEAMFGVSELHGLFQAKIRHISVPNKEDTLAISTPKGIAIVDIDSRKLIKHIQVQ